MTEGERRLAESLHPIRGVHALTVIYIANWPRCPGCRQAIRTDPDLAYELFLNAGLRWDGKSISHDELRNILGRTLGVRSLQPCGQLPGPRRPRPE